MTFLSKFIISIYILIGSGAGIKLIIEDNDTSLFDIITFLLFTILWPGLIGILIVDYIIKGEKE